MPFLTDVKNALSLLSKREWREFLFRVRVHVLRIDLKNTYLHELNLPEDHCHYYANSGGLHLEKVLRDLAITPRDAIVDFGSGKGGALITFSRYPFSKITGIELSPGLAAIAHENFRKLKITRITMIVGDAAEFTDLDGYNYFYFFNPFPLNVVISVMKNICASLARKPRSAKIIYFNPEFHDAIITDTPFLKIKEFHHHELGYYIYTNKS